jgi:hypothetical protein
VYSYRSPRLAADARSQAKRAFARLETGLTDYATKPRSPADRRTPDERDAAT